MMDGVPSKVNVLLWIASYPWLKFSLRKVSNPGLISLLFFLWKVSKSFVKVLFAESVQSWVDFLIVPFMESVQILC